MVRKRPYLLVYDFEIPRHLRAIERKHHSFIRETIEAQLTYEPDVETANRKPLERPVTFTARWELRFGPANRFRVYYRIEPEAYEVYVLAIGVKLRDVMYIGGEEYEL